MYKNLLFTYVLTCIVIIKICYKIIVTLTCFRAYNNTINDIFAAISANVFKICWTDTVTQHLQNVRIVLAKLDTDWLPVDLLSEFSKLAASTLCLFLQRDNIGLLENYSFMKNEQNGGPEEDQSLCVVWRPEARQYWLAKSLVSIDTDFTALRSW